MPETLPQYDGPYTPRMQFEDIWGSLAIAAAKFGRRDDQEVDYWERSHAGRHVAYTTNRETLTTSVELAVYSPVRTLSLMAAVRGNFMGHVDLGKIHGISFTMHEPQEAVDHDVASVEMTVDMGEDSFERPLTYEQFAEICEGSGVYEQEPVPRWKRLANWVMRNTFRRQNDDGRDWN